MKRVCNNSGTIRNLLSPGKPHQKQRRTPLRNIGNTQTTKEYSVCHREINSNRPFKSSPSRYSPARKLYHRQSGSMIERSLGDDIANSSIESQESIAASSLIKISSVAPYKDPSSSSKEKNLMQTGNFRLGKKVVKSSNENSPGSKQKLKSLKQKHSSPLNNNEEGQSRKFSTQLLRSLNFSTVFSDKNPDKIRKKIDKLRGKFSSSSYHSCSPQKQDLTATTQLVTDSTPSKKLARELDTLDLVSSPIPLRPSELEIQYDEDIITAKTLDHFADKIIANSKDSNLKKDAVRNRLDQALEMMEKLSAQQWIDDAEHPAFNVIYAHHTTPAELNHIIEVNQEDPMGALQFLIEFAKLNLDRNLNPKINKTSPAKHWAGVHLFEDTFKDNFLFSFIVLGFSAYAHITGDLKDAAKAAIKIRCNEDEAFDVLNMMIDFKRAESIFDEAQTSYLSHLSTTSGSKNIFANISITKPAGDFFSNYILNIVSLRDNAFADAITELQKEGGLSDKNFRSRNDLKSLQEAIQTLRDGTLLNHLN